MERGAAAAAASGAAARKAGRGACTARRLGGGARHGSAQLHHSLGLRCRQQAHRRGYDLRSCCCVPGGRPAAAAAATALACLRTACWSKSSPAGSAPLLKGLTSGAAAAPLLEGAAQAASAAFSAIPDSEGSANGDTAAPACPANGEICTGGATGVLPAGSLLLLERSAVPEACTGAGCCCWAWAGAESGTVSVRCAAGGREGERRAQPRL